MARFAVGDNWAGETVVREGIPGIKGESKGSASHLISKNHATSPTH